MNECSPINSLEKEMVRISGCPGGRQWNQGKVVVSAKLVDGDGRWGWLVSRWSTMEPSEDG